MALYSSAGMQSVYSTHPHTQSTGLKKRGETKNKHGGSESEGRNMDKTN